MESKRDQGHLDAWLNTCHDQAGLHDYDLSTPESIIFTSNATAALTPETIIGPYFVAGEYIRSDVTESQPGVPIHLDIQFVDVATCAPVPACSSTSGTPTRRASTRASRPRARAG
jgi:protocatechuate 3,4-dioxygenase beta subunit